MRLEHCDTPCRQFLRGLVNSIDAEIGLKAGSVAQIVRELNTWGKVLKFNNWVKHQKGNGKLQTTELEICRAAVQIAKACDVED